MEQDLVGDGFLADVMAFTSGDNRATRTDMVDGVPRLSNSFWTAKQRQGHPLHEISYRACFKAELPDFLISRLSSPGDTVLDPFMGRGTTPLQAALMGRLPMGNDINPLSSMLLAPRLAPPGMDDVEEFLSRLDLTSMPKDMPIDLLAFYHTDTLRELCILRETLEVEGAVNPVAAWVRMVALNRLTGHSSGFLSGYTLPPNQATSVAAQRRINAKRGHDAGCEGHQHPRRDVRQVILRKSASLLRAGVPDMPLAGQAVLMTGSADALNISDKSVDLVVTSPPFLDIVQYADDNWLRCWFGGIDSDALDISMHRTETGWTKMMHGVLTELSRVVRIGGHAVVEVGEVRRGTVRLEDAVLEAAAGTGMSPVCVLLNEQVFSKTARCWGVGNGKGKVSADVGVAVGAVAGAVGEVGALGALGAVGQGGTNTNRMVVLRRE